MNLIGEIENLKAKVRESNDINEVLSNIQQTISINQNMLDTLSQVDSSLQLFYCSYIEWHKLAAV